MFRALILSLPLAMALIPTVASAAAADVSPHLRARAEAICRNDALKLCADAASNEGAIVACMRHKRAMLTGPCRTVFDQVVRQIRR